MTETELDSLAGAFQACTLAKDQWTHLAHLKVGAWHVHRYGPGEALRRLRAGIRRLNDSHGVPNSETRGYHETITRAYVLLINTFLTGVSLEDGVNRLQTTDAATKDFLLNFYSRDVLMSSRARMEWVEPDLAPLAINKT